MMIERTAYYISNQFYPYRNLAVEEYLLEKVEEGECILYLWQNAHTIVIGKNQNARKECKADLLWEEEGHLVRRLSGGGAVYHDMGNLNFTFLIREEDYDVSRQLSVIIGALKRFGLQAEQTGRNDVVIDGRKFSGNAFYKTNGHCYHHGTLLVNVDMANLSRYLNVSLKKIQSKGVDSVRSRVVNLAELNPEITIETLKRALIEAFGEVYGSTPRRIEEEEIPSTIIHEKQARFESREWQLGRQFSYSAQLDERFPWGEIQLMFRVEKEQVAACQVYSDAMDETYIPKLGEALTGVEFSGPKLAEAIQKVVAENPRQEDMRRDVAELLRTSL